MLLLLGATVPVPARAAAIASPAVPAPPKCELTWPLPSFIQPLSWVDHTYPIRQMDGTMLRFDGATDVFYDGHRGLDIPVAPGTPVLAAADGLVTYAGWSDSGGNGVSLAHDGCRTIYFHSSALLARVGERVSRGQVIALTGTTGNSTGPHLHFEVRDLAHNPTRSTPTAGAWPGRIRGPGTRGCSGAGGMPQVVAPGTPAGPVAVPALTQRWSPARCQVIPPPSPAAP